MTREEIFTLEAMKCLIAKEENFINPKYISSLAVKVAISTLKELDKNISNK